MTKDEIIRLAIEHTISGLKFDEDGLLRFAKLVAQHEREACEALCKWRTGVQQVDAAIDTCAAAIRARGQ